MTDIVTNASTEIELIVDQPVATMWERVTDVARIGEWSPECVYGAWKGTPEPMLGARFEGRNRFPNGDTSTVECVVTAAEPRRVFEYVVLDSSGRVERPGSTWRYELAAGPTSGQALIRQRFVHGPGDSGVRTPAERDPANGVAIVAGRLEQIHHNMAVTIQAIASEGASK